MPSVTIKRVRSAPGTTQEADRVAERARDEGRGAEPRERFGPAVPRQQARRVRADAEEGRVPQRQNARVAEDEIQRQREDGRR